MQICGVNSSARSPSFPSRRRRPARSARQTPGAGQQRCRYHAEVFPESQVSPGVPGTPGQPPGDLPDPEDPPVTVAARRNTGFRGKMGVKMGLASSYLESALTIRCCSVAASSRVGAAEIKYFEGSDIFHGVHSSWFKNILFYNLLLSCKYFLIL